MGEAIISRGGTSTGGSSGNDKGLITEIFVSDTVWKVPEGIRNNQVSVRIFGGGCLGHGGYMNNNIISINNENFIYITIGKSGGGTTSFGTHLYALGANSDGGGSGGGVLYRNTYGSGGGIGYQFGGGGSALIGGNYFYGKSGGKWGGSGGSSQANNLSLMQVVRGGCLYENSQNIYEVTGYSGLAGNGGYNKINATNGTNTIGMGLEFEGAGLAGSSINITTGYVGYGGGGGYGGNGGNGVVNYFTMAGGGGGGYGANGGDGYAFNGGSQSRSMAAGGGGGGYGGDGGSSCFYLYGGANNIIVGGGGGYGKFGKGGGMHNGEIIFDGGIAAGAATGAISGKPGNGICIIQYYID